MDEIIRIQEGQDLQSVPPDQVVVEFVTPRTKIATLAECEGEIAMLTQKIAELEDKKAAAEEKKRKIEEVLANP